MTGDELPHFASIRLWTVGFYAALLYYLACDRKRTATAPADELPVSDSFADWETVPRRILLYVASVLVAVLIWLEVSPALVAPGLGLMALVLFEVGKWRPSVHLRLQGYLVVLVGFVRLVQFNFTLAEPYRFASVRLWTVGFFAVLLYYLYRRLAPADRRTPLLGDSDDTPRELFEDWDWEDVPRRAMLHAGSALVAGLLWYELPPAPIAPAWAAMALVVFELGGWLRNRDLGFQCQALLTLGLVRLAQFNYGAETPWLAVSLRAWTVSLFALILYVLSWRLRSDSTDHALWAPKGTRRLVLHAGSALLTVLLWYELPALALAPAYTFAAILLLELGLRCRYIDLRMESYAMALLGFSRFVAVNLLAEQMWNGVSLRLLSGALVAAHLYYLFFVLRARRSSAVFHRREGHSSDVLSALSVAAVALLLRFELVTDWVAAAWGVLAAVYLLWGVASRDRHFRFLGLILAVATVVRTVFTNFTAPVAGPNSLVSTAAAILALFACYALLLWQRDRDAKSEREPAPQPYRFEKYMLPACLFIATGLMLVLTYQRAPENGLTLFCAAEGMLLFLGGLVARHQAARLLGLGLLCVCVLKLFIYDLRGLETFARIISFIGLGLILLAVSFLYTKYSALVRRYL